MKPNGLAVTIVALDETGQPLEQPATFIWSPGAIAALEAEGGALAAVGKATAAEVRRALTTMFPKLKAPEKKIVLPNG